MRFACWALSVLLGSVVWAQQPQIVLLRYELRWDDRYLSFIGGRLKPATPGDAKLPQLTDPKPKFLKCKFVDGERLFIVTRQGDEWLLYADTDGDNDLTDEQPIRGYTDDPYLHFGPIPMRFYVNGKTVLQHLGVSQHLYGDEQKGALNFYLRVVSQRKGTLVWQGKTVSVTVQDEDLNGAITHEDEIIWVEGEESRWLPAAGCIGMDGNFFRYQVAPTGEQLVIEPVSVSPAPLRFNGESLVLHLRDKDGAWVLEGKGGQLIAPVGEFQITAVTLTRKDPKGRLWQLTASAFGPAAPKLNIPPSGTSLNLEPLNVSAMMVNRKGDEFEFSLEIKTVNGMQIVDLRVGDRRPPEPKLQLIAPNGKVVGEPQFHYG